MEASAGDADAGEPEETDIKVPTEEDVVEPQQAAEPADDMAATAIISAVDMPEPEAPAPAAAAAEQDDVLNEVDVYLAYGRFQQAEDLIKDALKSDAEREDLNLKLLEIYLAGSIRMQFRPQAV